MKKVNMVYVDGFYRPEKQARKLHPEGYDSTFTKVVEVPSFGDNVKKAAQVLIYSLVVLTLAAAAYYVALHM